MEMTTELINQTNQVFWEQVQKKVQRIISERPLFLEEALREMQSELHTCPVYSRRPLERIMLNYDRQFDLYRPFYQKEFSQRGGRAKKMDALGGLIQSKVQQEPEISYRELWNFLRSQKGIGAIDEVGEDKIWLANGKVVPKSGLKHRLSRARKTLKSR